MRGFQLASALCTYHLFPPPPWGGGRQPWEHLQQMSNRGGGRQPWEHLQQMSNRQAFDSKWLLLSQAMPFDKLESNDGK